MERAEAGRKERAEREREVFVHRWVANIFKRVVPKEDLRRGAAKRSHWTIDERIRAVEAVRAFRRENKDCNSNEEAINALGLECCKSQLYKWGKDMGKYLNAKNKRFSVRMLRKKPQGSRPDLEAKLFVACHARRAPRPLCAEGGQRRGPGFWALSAAAGV